jgi:hypothetical protein
VVLTGTTLTALVAAYSGDTEGLYALRPLAGATVLEHQVRRLAAAGATKIILLIDDWPPALAQPLGRLRADGISVDALRGLPDAVDRLAALPRLLLLADGVLPERALLDRMADAPVPSLAVLPDLPEVSAFERIDAGARWAGVATLDGQRVAEAAAMLGEWDPVSTLMRRLVQEGATRIDSGTPPMLADAPEGVSAAEAGLVAASREAPVGLADRFIVLPLVDAALPLFFAKAIEPLWLGLAALVLASLGALMSIAGLRWPALIFLLLAAPLARMASRLATVQARALPYAVGLRIALPAGLGIGAVGLGWALAQTSGQWGWWLIASIVLASFAGLMVQRRVLAWAGEPGEPRWLARASDMPWLLVPFALAGLWGTGFCTVAAYAAGSLGWAMRRLLRYTRG